jgi:major membrane immunogen (membrane-anchored lipoprotein)
MSNNVKRKVYLENEQYKVRLEEFKKQDQKVLFVHVELKDTLIPSVIKELREEFDKLKSKIKLAGYSKIHSYSATPKFYSMFKGYEDIGPMDWEGKEYRVLKWELK